MLGGLGSILISVMLLAFFSYDLYEKIENPQYKQVSYQHQYIPYLSDANTALNLSTSNQTIAIGMPHYESLGLNKMHKTFRVMFYSVSSETNITTGASKSTTVWHNATLCTDIYADQIA